MKPLNSFNKPSTGVAERKHREWSCAKSLYVSYLWREIFARSINSTETTRAEGKTWDQAAPEKSLHQNSVLILKTGFTGILSSSRNNLSKREKLHISKATILSLPKLHDSSLREPARRRWGNATADALRQPVVSVPWLPRFVWLQQAAPYDTSTAHLPLITQQTPPIYRSCSHCFFKNQINLS